ncbi:MAG: UUP1 family membrane protein, partial [Planctomycetota bacterium]
MLRYRDKLMITLLIAGCLLIVFWRLSIVDAEKKALLPERHYQFMVEMELEGHNKNVSVRMTLPLETGGQSVRDEGVKSSNFPFSIEKERGARFGVWEGSQVTGEQNLVYSCTVQTNHEQYELAPSLTIPESYPAQAQPYLLSTDTIQSDAEEVAALIETIVPPDQRENMTAIITQAYDYCHASIESVKITGTTDALTCLRLGEASC